MTRQSACFISTLLVAGLASSPAFSEGNKDEIPEWNIQLGAGAMVGPKYEGSDETETQPIPHLSVSWRELVHFNVADGLGIDVYDHDGIRLSTWLGYDMGREESDSDDLRGLGDIDGGAVASIDLEYETDWLTPYVSVQRQFSGAEGTTADIGVSTGVPIMAMLRGNFSAARAMDEAPGLMLELDASATWADDDYMGSYFGINAAQAARSVYSVHSAESGFKSAGLGMTLMYPINESWAAMGMVNYNRLLGDAADSPLVKDENQISGGVMLVWSWQD